MVTEEIDSISAQGDRPRALHGAWPLAVLAGLVWGTGSSLINASTSSVAQGVSQVTNGPWAELAWCWAPFTVGVAVVRQDAAWWRAMLGGAICGALALVLGMVGYYTTDLLRGVYGVATDPSGTGWYAFWSDLRSWCVVGGVTGLIFGFLGAVARRGGPLRFWALVPLPVVFLRRYLTAGWSPARVLTAATPAAKVALLLVAVLLIAGAAAGTRRLGQARN